VRSKIIRGKIIALDMNTDEPQRSITFDNGRANIDAAVRQYGANNCDITFSIQDFYRDVIDTRHAIIYAIRVPIAMLGRWLRT
jgi:hypothetical protein